LNKTFFQFGSVYDVELRFIVARYNFLQQELPAALFYGACFARSGGFTVSIRLDPFL